MTSFLLVGAGGALGAMARYGAGLAQGRLAPGSDLPWATLAVNGLGGLLMGALVGWLAHRGGGGEGARLFAGVGVLGGFTTFSAFSLETALMIERRAWTGAAAYAAGSVLLAVAAVFAGLWLARRAFA